MITLYDPTSGTFKPLNVQAQSPAVFQTALLLNILIEMKVQSVILKEMNRDVVGDTLESLRADVASDTPDPVSGY